jgi:soluble lytic murein transglycosylase-like protein
MRTIRSVGHHLLVAAGASVALLAGLTLTRPVFVGRAPVLRAVLAHRYLDSTTIRAPWIVAPVEEALRTPQFIADRAAFVADLVRTGKVNRSRAWDIADVAVREAYTRKVPPALVLGVMLTEDDALTSVAQSSVGAIGLMQIHAPAWRGLEKWFGANLRSDSTNLKYGIYILGFLATKSHEIASIEASWRNALLRYNGCVSGTNTPRCQTYPDVVRRNVLVAAKYSCAGRDFNACVATPLWMAERDTMP